MTHYETEIIDIHVALEAWLGNGQGELNALTTRFRPDFLMVPPSGAHIDYAGLVGFLESQRGSRPGLKIELDEITTLQTWDQGAVVHYRETQTRPNLPVNVRWSTAVLIQEGEKLTWRLLHETAQP
ncbi:DUF4440 domain-containing protein [Huaxiibacter chinensis]|uniref:DUF4440 domain-containing protein n=1 Tax=Huaxiibacter chinensis TaxID=2899785 RepID=UPI003F9BC0CF